ncbi:hypothetical protein BJV78DRAFT_1174252, partial [Lactifluus subvellereus]
PREEWPGNTGTMTYDPQADKGTSSCWASRGPAKRGPRSSQKICCPFIVRSCWLLRHDAKAESETRVARVLSIVKGNTLGVDDCDCDRKGKARRDENRKGHPLDHDQKTHPIGRARSYLHSDLRSREKVAEALNANKVRFLEIEGLAAQRARIQNNSKEGVLLLHVMD